MWVYVRLLSKHHHINPFTSIYIVRLQVYYYMEIEKQTLCVVSKFIYQIKILFLSDIYVNEKKTYGIYYSYSLNGI